MFSRSISLGTWFGITIRIDLSWFIIFFLVTWSLVTGVFPDTYPELGLEQNIILGVITSILFFASALAHELAHSIVANNLGATVQRITLFLFGGAAQIEEEINSPSVEFKVAAVGPLASLALALLFWSLKKWSVTLGLGQSCIAVFSTLASLNIVLAIFNLLPGYPLDGGRILRAGIWSITNNFTRSTRWAAKAGRAVAWLIIITGLLNLFVSNFSQGVWLVFLGLFLDHAVESSERGSLMNNVLRDVSVSSVMQTDPKPVPYDTTVEAFIRNHLIPSHRRCLVVQDKNNEIIGTIGVDTVRDHQGEDLTKTTVNNIMQPINESLILTPKDRLSTALKKLHQAETSALPVMKNGQLHGILSEEDIGIYASLVINNPIKKPTES